MKLNRRLNQLSAAGYRHVLANYPRYPDFNSLGLFRSILENEQLDLAQRLQIRDAAIAVFPKFYEFLQLKDPDTYLRLRTLGQELTSADKQAVSGRGMWFPTDRRLGWHHYRNHRAERQRKEQKHWFNTRQQLDE